MYKFNENQDFVRQTRIESKGHEMLGKNSIKGSIYNVNKTGAKMESYGSPNFKAQVEEDKPSRQTKKYFTECVYMHRINWFKLDYKIKLFKTVFFIFDVTSVWDFYHYIVRHAHMNKTERKR